MMELVKLTGKVKDGLYVEVEMLFSVKRWAKPVHGFPFLGMPTQKWVDKYKNTYMGVVSEYGKKSTLLLMGVVATDNGKTPSETLNGNTFVLTEKFRIWIDDNNNKLTIDTLDEGEILLGNDKVSEPVLLGKKTRDFLEEFISEVSAITVTTSLGTMPILNKIQVEKLKLKLDDLMSKKVKTK